MKNTKVHFKFLLSLLILFIIIISCSKNNKTTEKTYSQTQYENARNNSDYDYGIELFNAKRFVDARIQFDKVKESDSIYAMAQKYIEDCNKEIKIDIERTKKEREVQKIEDQKYYKTKAGKIYKYCQSNNAYVTKEDCESAANGKYWIGMNYWLLVGYRGRPNAVNPSNYGHGTQYQYCWFNYSPSCFYDHDGDDKIDAYN